MTGLTETLAAVRALLPATEAPQWHQWADSPFDQTLAHHAGREVGLDPHWARAYDAGEAAVLASHPEARWCSDLLVMGAQASRAAERATYQAAAMVVSAAWWAGEAELRRLDETAGVPLDDGHESIDADELAGVWLDRARRHADLAKACLAEVEEACWLARRRRASAA